MIGRRFNDCVYGILVSIVYRSWFVCYMYSSTSPSPALMYIYITASDANGIILATGRSDQHLSLRGPGLDDAFEGLRVSAYPARLD